LTTIMRMTTLVRDFLRPTLQKFFCGCFLFTPVRGVSAQPPAPTRKIIIPSVLHAVLPADTARPRTILVGDVHGCLDELDALLRECSHDERTDRVVLVGDLVNKGPKSAECVREARMRGYSAVRGNHDDAALFAHERRERGRRDGTADRGADKYEYVDGFDAADLRFLRELPYTLTLEGEGVLVVHAGVVPGVPLPVQEPAHMYTMRNLVRFGGAADAEEEPPSVAPLVWEARSSPDEGIAWATAWQPDEANFPGVRHIVFGHDAKRGLQQTEHVTGLDTGCCYGKRLTALVLPERRIVSVPAARMYSPPRDL